MTIQNSLFADFPTISITVFSKDENVLLFSENRIEQTLKSFCCMVNLFTHIIIILILKAAPSPSAILPCLANSEPICGKIAFPKTLAICS